MTERDQTTPPQETPLRMALPETLDLRAATPLASELLTARGAALTLDASRVASVGAQCLQVILSAKLTWRRDGQSFAIVDPSEAWLASLTDAGLPIETFMESDIDT